MKSTGIVFKSRKYRTAVAPPAVILEDESRWGNDGAFLGPGEPDWVQLPSGLWVKSFDGTNDYIDFGNPLFTRNQKGAFSVWFNTNSEDQQTLFAFTKPATGPTDEFRFELLASQRVNFILYQGAVTGEGYTAVASFILGNWYQTVLTSDGTTTTIYLNGGAPALTKTGVDGLWLGDASIEADTLSLGINRRLANFLAPYSGLMSSPKFYEYALTPAERDTHYQAERRYFGV